MKEKRLTLKFFIIQKITVRYGWQNSIPQSRESACFSRTYHRQLCLARYTHMP